MGIKRLLYEQKGFPVNVTYEGEGEIKTLRAECGITAAFTAGEDTFSEDSIFLFPDGKRMSYRMGWNTAAVFVKSEKGFRVKSLHDPVTKEPKMSPLRELYTTEFSQIVTQAIDTCILILIETANEYILAHFMESRLPDFVKYLSKLVSGDQINALFCSTFYLEDVEEETGGEEEDEEEEFVMTWQEAFEHLQRYPKEAAVRIVFKRNEYGNDCYFNHMEFGIGMEGGQMVYFGDIGCSTPEIRESGSPECSCALFAYNQVGELQDLTRIAGEVFETGSAKP